jgi:DNA-binding NarL/FixJ family response regulator
MADKKTKVLLVDDDQIIRIYFHDVFWINGFENRCELYLASDLEAAERVIGNPETRPDIIFLDLVLPKKVDGRTISDPKNSFEFLKKIKADHLMAKTSVIIFSGESDKKLEKEAKKYGADGYLRKEASLAKDIVSLTNNLLAKYES